MDVRVGVVRVGSALAGNCVVSCEFYFTCDEKLRGCGQDFLKSGKQKWAVQVTLDGVV
ncbi:hypothetical protein FRC0285_01583 [Corynebacterium diphtheriae]|nr:hypothetical protein FRC0285_01583 [Corynebacterium diphtheriae]